MDIEQTSDIKKIRRAYAKQAAKYHPEEFPEEFQQIHQAYETALQLAKSGRREQEKSVEAEGVSERECAQGVSERECAQGVSVNEEESDTDWQEARRISELADKFVKEQEDKKVRSALYSAFLPDVALGKLDDFWRAKGVQSHRTWCSYIQEPVFLEAVHDPDFRQRFTIRIGTLIFQRRTRKKIKEALEKEIPEEFENEVKLRMILNGKRMLSETQRRMRKCGWCFAALIAAFCIWVWNSERKMYIEQEELRKIHSTDIIEEYINDKYQITCKISKCDEAVFNGFIYKKDEEDEIEYYLAETEEIEGMPESFHLAWVASSRECDGIRDDLKEETISMYKEEYGFSSKKGSFLIQRSFYEKFESRFLKLLHALRDSHYVQIGNTVELSVKGHILDYQGVDFIIDREHEIDEEEVRTSLRECMERGEVYDGQQEEPLWNRPFESD